MYALADTVDVMGPTREVAAPASEEFMARLTELERRAAAIETWTDEPTTAGARALVVELRALIGMALELFSGFEGLAPANDELEPADDVDGWFSACTAVHAPPGMGDICFVSVFELRRVLSDLEGADDVDEQLARAERARRKLLRAARAALATGRPSDAAPTALPDPGPYRPEDIDSALSVRRLYAVFRRTLRRPSDDSAAAVLEAVRYAAGALASLVADPAYSAVRASDRALFRRLRERIILWARHDRPSQVGLEIMGDVWTVADLLRGINRRQELRAHDAALLREVLAASGESTVLWVRKLDLLLGLDDELDGMLERSKTEAATPLKDEMLRRLAELRV